jgi:hypothetical protein
MANASRLVEQAGIRGVKYANCTGVVVCALRRNSAQNRTAPAKRARVMSKLHSYVSAPNLVTVRGLALVF